MGKPKGELLFTIGKDGKVRCEIRNNNDSDHFRFLEKFLSVLSDGDKRLVQAHRHDHGDGLGAHTHIGGAIAHEHIK